MPKKASIYSDCNPEMVKLFEQAGHPAKVMCVALDYAKAQHTALICNGQGDLLKGSFVVDNTPAGTTQLLDQVRQCAKSKKIPPEWVFFGGEDCPYFAENFLRRLRQEDYLVVRVNAWDAKQQRGSLTASNDSLDLLGVARCCLKRRGQPVRDLPEAYANLRIVTRERDKLVRSATGASNRIHTYVDRLFPSFLSADQSGLAPFCEASLELMSEQFSAAAIRRRSQSSLGQWLARRGVAEPLAVAGQLRELAKRALMPAPEQLVLLQRSLGHLVGLYRNLQQSIGSLDRELAYWLARTPGALLTSISGIGVTLAAGWMAELGPPAQWRAVRQLSAYAGVVPRTKQTGGPQKPPVTGHVQQRCNKRFKNVVLLAVEKVRQFGPEDLRRDAQKLQAQGSHTEFALAKRLVRLAKYLVHTGTIYRPKALMDPNASKETLVLFYQEAWQKLLLKWKAKADLKDVFAPKHQLGQWRQMVQELYALELPLPAQRAARKAGASTP
jgi:transposase